MRIQTATLSRLHADVRRERDAWVEHGQLKRRAALARAAGDHIGESAALMALSNLLREVRANFPGLCLR